MNQALRILGGHGPQDISTVVKAQIMKLLRSIFHALFVCALIASSETRLMAADARQPNVVVILSDDFGYGSAGCCCADPKLISTPNLDRLAKEGRRFTDANTTSSVCSPTRYS